MTTLKMYYELGKETAEAYEPIRSTDSYEVSLFGDFTIEGIKYLVFCNETYINYLDIPDGLSKELISRKEEFEPNEDNDESLYICVENGDEFINMIKQ